MNYNEIKDLLNVCLDDPILDYLKFCGVKKGYLSDTMFDEFNRNLQLKYFLENQQKKFKEKIQTLLKECYTSEFYEGSLSQALKKNKGIIWNPLFVDHQKKWKSSGDILIKIRILRNLIRDLQISTEYDEKYILLTIRYSTIHCTNGNYSTSNPFDMFYKMKSAFEQSVLLGFASDKLYHSTGFIGRKYKISTKDETKYSNENLDRDYSDNWGDFVASSGLIDNCLGMIALDNPLKHIDSLNEKMREYSHYQYLFKTDQIILGYNMFPNMKNTYDFPWHHSKKRISKEIGEMTSLIYCSPKNRNKAIAYGIKNVQDPFLTADILGIHQDTKQKQINAILRANTSNELLYGQLSQNDLQELTKDYAVEFFVDFETLNGIDDNFDNFPYYGGHNLIFNIGCYYKINGVYHFQSFWLNDINNQEMMINDFIVFMNKICETAGVLLLDCPVYHWTQAEKIFWKDRYPLKWIDLNAYFTKLPLGLNGSFNYKLKNIARSLFDKGLIKTNWSHSFADGLGAMTGYIYLMNKNNNYYNQTDFNLINEIIEYNKIDCVVLSEIKDFLINFAFRQHK